MAALERMYAKLRLKVNREKSKVDLAHKRSLLSYSFWYARGGAVMCRVAPKALRALKQRVRSITRRSGGRSMRSVVAELRKYLPGWNQYFQLADTPKELRRIRQMAPPPSAGAATQAVEARLEDLYRDAPPRTAGRDCGTSRGGQPTLVASGRHVGPRRTHCPLLRPPWSTQTCRLTSTFRTAGCGPACPVVWQGSSAAALPPMPIRMDQHCGPAGRGKRQPFRLAASHPPSRLRNSTATLSRSRC